MEIRDLGDEAIDEILAEAIDGMKRRTNRRWALELDGVHGDLKVLRDGKHMTTANVRPAFVRPFEAERISQIVSEPVLILRFRSQLRRLVLEATQAVSPVPDAADIPAALSRAFSAIGILDEAAEGKDLTLLPVVRHDLYRILDHLTGVDHSGCSGRPGAADYGRPEEVAP